MLEIENLAKRYGDAVAIDGVSAKFKKGEVSCVLGENGAGKTTLLKAIAMIAPADFGRVFIDGEDVSQNPLAAKRKIGYVAENPAFLENFSAGEYLRLVAVLAKSNRGEIDAAVEMFSLQSVLKKRISSLSKGFRQRLAFAQSALKRPEIYLLDEPSSGLDPVQIVQMRSFIARAKENATVILSTHLMQEVSAVCDKVFIMRNGKFVENGTISEISGRNGGIEGAILKISEQKEV